MHLHRLAALAGLSLLCGAEALHARHRRGAGRAKPRSRRSAHSDDDDVVMGGVQVYDYSSAMEHALKTTQHGAGAGQEAAPWIVMFHDNITEERLDVLCSDIFAGCSAHGDRSNKTGRSGLPYLVATCTPAQLNASLAQVVGEATFATYNTPTRVADAHLDFSQHLPDTGAQAATWGLNRINRDSAPGVGRAVHVYVLDTGVRCTHSQFGGRAIPTIESLGHVHKCSCQNTSCANDTHGHGTHCAGTVGGIDYGVATHARIHSVKVLADDGTGYTSWSVAAEDWILNNGMRPAVISMSLGGAGNNQAERLSIETLVANGIPVVVAAGNEESDACGFNPSWVPGAITVGSTTSADALSWFSNYGTCVDILAPGSSVLSAGQGSDTVTAWKSGTSMACPHVSGAVAVLFDLNPTMTPAQIRAELLAKAEDGAISGLDSDTVNKLLQVQALSGGANGAQVGGSCFGAHEAEDADVGGGEVGSTLSGYSGSGYVDFANSTGGYIDWALQGCTAGSHVLSFKYALRTGNRPLRLTVNGAVEVSSMDFPATGGWDQWQEVVHAVSLRAGANTVSLAATGYRGGTIDKLTVSQ